MNFPNPSAIEDIKTLPFVWTVSLTLTTVGQLASQQLTMQTDAMLLVQHLDVSLYDQDGAVPETDAVRDEVLVQIVNSNSSDQYFNQAMDLFMFRRYTQSQAFRPFIIPPRDQYTVQGQITTFVNGGTAVGALPYKINLSVIGRKILVR